MGAISGNYPKVAIVYSQLEKMEPFQRRKLPTSCFMFLQDYGSLEACKIPIVEETTDPGKIFTAHFGSGEENGKSELD